MADRTLLRKIWIIKAGKKFRITWNKSVQEILGIRKKSLYSAWYRDAAFLLV